jgi:hypothetical protein
LVGLRRAEGEVDSLLIIGFSTKIGEVFVITLDSQDLTLVYDLHVIFPVKSLCTKNYPEILSNVKIIFNCLRSYEIRLEGELKLVFGDFKAISGVIREVFQVVF